MLSRRAARTRTAAQRPSTTRTGTRTRTAACDCAVLATASPPRTTTPRMTASTPAATSIAACVRPCLASLVSGPRSCLLSQRACRAPRPPGSHAARAAHSVTHRRPGERAEPDPGHPRRAHERGERALQRQGPRRGCGPHGSGGPPRGRGVNGIGRVVRCDMRSSAVALYAARYLQP